VISLYVSMPVVTAACGDSGDIFVCGQTDGISVHEQTGGIPVGGHAGGNGRM
jgi:hypothetical protein